jgi:hypothetical protein
MRRMVGLLGLALVAGCSGGTAGDPPAIGGTAVTATASSAAPAGTTSAAPPPSTPTWQPTAEQLGTVCNGASFADAPERAASGPHPTAVYRGEPGPWVADPGLLGGGTELGMAQQVACLSVAVLGAQVGSCPYPGQGTFALRSASYSVRLVEVRGGTQVLSKRVVGADRTCPKALRSVPNEKVLPTGLTPRQLTAELGTAVTG